VFLEQVNSLLSVVKPIKPLTYVRINSAEIEADACVIF